MSDIDAKNTLITGFHHVALIACDYDVSKHFYTQILGLKVIAETYDPSANPGSLICKFQAVGNWNYSRFPNRQNVCRDPKHVG